MEQGQGGVTKASTDGKWGINMENIHKSAHIGYAYCCEQEISKTEFYKKDDVCNFSPIVSQVDSSGKFKLCDSVVLSKRCLFENPDQPNIESVQPMGCGYLSVQPVKARGSIFVKRLLGHLLEKDLYYLKRS